MRRRAVIRKSTKWTALVVAVLVWVGFGVSSARIFGYASNSPKENRNCYAGRGVLWYLHVPRTYWPPGEVTKKSWYSRPRTPPGLAWWPSTLARDWRATLRPGCTLVFIPLWLPALALSGLAAFLFRHDTLLSRRERAGQCPSCSYDRTGIAASAPCPECGTTPQAAGQMAR